MSENHSEDQLEGALRSVKKAGFNTEAVELMANGMQASFEALGGETYVPPQVLITSMVKLVKQEWGNQAQGKLIEMGLYSTERFGELAHLVSESLRIPTGPEVREDYRGLDTGDIVLPGKPVSAARKI